MPDGKQVTEITLAVTRSFKNAETGEYDCDFLNCTVWQGLAVNLSEYCKKGMTIGIKARLSQKKIYINEEKYFNAPEIIAEQITYISKNS